MVLSTQNRMADNGSSCRGRRLIEDRAMLLLDVGFVKTNLWNGDRPAALASCAWGRNSARMFSAFFTDD